MLPSKPNLWVRKHTIEHRVNERRSGNSSKWEKRSSSDYRSHASVLNRLSVLRRDPRLVFILDCQGFFHRLCYGVRHAGRGAVAARVPPGVS